MEAAARSGDKKRKSRPSDVFLPDDIIESVLSFLPVKQEMQIGAAVKRFRHSSLVSRDLDLGKGFVTHRQRRRFVAIVDGILKAHAGAVVRRLSLYVPFSYSVPCSKVVEWVSFAVQKRVEELDLEFPSKYNYVRLPLHLICAASLKSLRLSGCVFFHPTIPFQISAGLTTLLLHRFCIPSSLFDGVLRHCVSLETLELERCQGGLDLDISAPHLTLRRLSIVDCTLLSVVALHAPNLTCLTYRGRPSALNLSHKLAALKVAVIAFKYRASSIIQPKAIHLLPNIATTSTLTVNGEFLENVILGTEVDRELIPLLNKLENLKELNLSAGGANCSFTALDIAVFVAECPNLVRVCIDLQGFSFESRSLFWQWHQRAILLLFSGHLKNLTTIEINGFKFHEQELLLVKNFLRNASMLERIVLIIHESEHHKIQRNNVSVHPDLRPIRCASPKAKLVIRNTSASGRWPFTLSQLLNFIFLEII